MFQAKAITLATLITFHLTIYSPSKYLLGFDSTPALHWALRYLLSEVNGRYIKPGLWKKTVGRKNTPWYGNEDVGSPLEKLGPGLSGSSSPRPPSQLTAVSRAAALHMSSPTPLVPLQTGLGQFSQSWNHCSPVLWYPREHMHCEPLKYPQHRRMRPAVWGMKNDQQMRPSCILQNEFPFWSGEVSGFK